MPSAASGVNLPAHRVPLSPSSDPGSGASPSGSSDPVGVDLPVPDFVSGEVPARPQLKLEFESDSEPDASTGRPSHAAPVPATRTDSPSGSPIRDLAVLWRTNWPGTDEAEAHGEVSSLQDRLSSTACTSCASSSRSASTRQSALPAPWNRARLRARSSRAPDMLSAVSDELQTQSMSSTATVSRSGGALSPSNNACRSRAPVPSGPRAQPAAAPTAPPWRRRSAGQAAAARCRVSSAPAPALRPRPRSPMADLHHFFAGILRSQPHMGNRAAIREASIAGLRQRALWHTFRSVRPETVAQQRMLRHQSSSQGRGGSFATSPGTVQCTNRGPRLVAAGGLHGSRAAAGSIVT
jgi:hypothetical protein